MPNQEAPSLVAVAIGAALVAGITGYYLGQARSIGLFGSSLPSNGTSNRNATASELGKDYESDLSDAASDSDAQDLGELKDFSGSIEECKLILVVRSDLGMTKGKCLDSDKTSTLAATFNSTIPSSEHKLTPCSRAALQRARDVHRAAVLTARLGKIAAQCGHATLACYKALVRANPAHPILKQWERLGQAKVALKVGSEDEMLMLQAQAISLGLCARVIHDAGRTQIASGSATVLGIGPAPKSKVDEVTGHLSLL